MRSKVGTFVLLALVFLTVAAIQQTQNPQGLTLGTTGKVSTVR